MDQQIIIEGIEQRAKALNVPMSRICATAGVHPTTFSRWKLSERNPKPMGISLKSLSALERALLQIETAAAAPKRKRAAA